jgi:hypothetical protein
MTTHYEAGLLIIDHNRCCYGKRLSIKASVHSLARVVDPAVSGIITYEKYSAGADNYFQLLFYTYVIYNMGRLQLDTHEVAANVSENPEPVF